MRSAVLTLAAMGVLFAPAARANDSTAELTAGGLVLKATPDIEMRAEDLFISRQRVNVRYRFFNKAATDETVTVAFPMPDLPYDGESNVSVPDEESDNFLKFETRVDGKPVIARVEQKAVLPGSSVDVTKTLAAHKIPLLQTAKRTEAALAALDKAAEKQLVDAEIIRAEDFDRGKGVEHHLTPLWTLKTTFYWHQTFPARKEMVVEHAYTPSVGSTVETYFFRAKDGDADKARYMREYCPDAAFVAGIKALTRKGPNGDAVPPEYRVGYILKTGANWAGPIGDFRLTVDKGSPKALVSFCETGVKKVGPTTFEVRHANFKPTQDLHILIVESGAP